jgi:hypothetical protein
VRDHPTEEEKCVGASSPCRGMGSDSGLKCGEGRWWLGHWCGREAEGEEGGMLTRPVKKNQRNGGHDDGWCLF